MNWVVISMNWAVLSMNLYKWNLYRDPVTRLSSPLVVDPAYPAVQVRKALKINHQFQFGFFNFSMPGSNWGREGRRSGMGCWPGCYHCARAQRGRKMKMKTQRNFKYFCKGGAKAGPWAEERKSASWLTFHSNLTCAATYTETLSSWLNLHSQFWTRWPLPKILH